MIKSAEAWTIAKDNQGLVIDCMTKQFGWIMERSKTGAMDIEDYYSAGLHGLYRAAMKFDPARGCTFSTYAYNWVRQAISRAYRTRGFKFVKVPCWAFDRLSKIQKEHKGCAKRWIEENGSAHVRSAQNALSDGIYLDDAFETAEGMKHTYDEAILMVPDGKALHDMQGEDRMRILLLAVRTLAPREREAIMWFYGFKTKEAAGDYKAIAKKMKIANGRVRALVSAAKRRIKDHFKKQNIKQTDMAETI